MTSKEFKALVSAVISMSTQEQEKLMCRLKTVAVRKPDEDTNRSWCAVGLLKHLVANSSDLSVAATALVALSEKDSDSI